METVRMHLIFTHEQADFDAVAALFAARLLDSGALAVLPRRINRNVRAYLTLYADSLSFIDFDEIPRGKIQRLTLVDTQTSVSLKGLTAKTEVHVIDHHPQDKELDPSWSVHLEEIGATTTLLVEALQDAGVKPGTVEATLLLLGIYEDTGSLSYASTTSRDVQASAWLLDCGANLGVAIDFLNHPLSNEQRSLYERLLEAAETIEIHGLSVIIAGAAAENLVDEISTLAHKLRDVFDPAGLFVLVLMNGSVQLVARSSSDALDVSRVAEHFGGGGHDRAAAALIRDQSLEKVTSELLDLLPDIIQPPKTVGEIMSREPQVLSPGVTVEQASERMQRFGHEGYPVVDGDKILGLLTRRAVDRAMSHGMGDRPVSSVMEAGAVVVHPSDSVQQLQQVMMEHNWGQVPVADRESGKIIGIVTRTDLLKTLAPETMHASDSNLADMLAEALPAARVGLLKAVARQAEANRDALYIVGGFVRDLLLGAPSTDFDLVVEGDAIPLARKLAKHYGGRVSSHRRFGTAKWRLDHENPQLLEALGMKDPMPDDLPATLDFVTARAEFYTHPTALPSVQSGSIKLDLHRRDFTINTLAIRLDGQYYGQLLDYWGGGQDLRSGLVRVLHSISFVDDPTRALRAVRLEQRLGFVIEERTQELLSQALPLLDRVSGDRIRHELESIFEEVDLPQIMARLEDISLLTAIHPALTWDRWLEERFLEACRFDAPVEWGLATNPLSASLIYASWLFRLSGEDAKSVCKRLRFSAAMQRVLLDANNLGRDLPAVAKDGVPSAIVSLLDEVREQALVAAWVAFGKDQDSRQAVDMYLRKWRYVQPKTDGNTLREIGLPPGPSYKQVLWDLRAAWLDGQIRSKKDEKELLNQLVEASKTQSNGLQED
jgi:tRNA nucleotidyltransferase (CCA-adding enzyme)